MHVPATHRLAQGETRLNKLQLRHLDHMDELEVG
jgi:hypothetical protein